MEKNNCVCDEITKESWSESLMSVFNSCVSEDLNDEDKFRTRLESLFASINETIPSIDKKSEQSVEFYVQFMYSFTHSLKAVCRDAQIIFSWMNTMVTSRVIFKYYIKNNKSKGLVESNNDRLFQWVEHELQRISTNSSRHQEILNSMLFDMKPSLDIDRQKTVTTVSKHYTTLSPSVKEALKSIYRDEGSIRWAVYLIANKKDPEGLLYPLSNAPHYAPPVGPEDEETRLTSQNEELINTVVDEAVRAKIRSLLAVLVPIGDKGSGLATCPEFVALSDPYRIGLKRDATEISQKKDKRYLIKKIIDMYAREAAAADLVVAKARSQSAARRASFGALTSGDPNRAPTPPRVRPPSPFGATAVKARPATPPHDRGQRAPTPPKDRTGNVDRGSTPTKREQQQAQLKLPSDGAGATNALYGSINVMRPSSPGKPRVPAGAAQIAVGMMSSSTSNRPASPGRPPATGIKERSSTPPRVVNAGMPPATATNLPPRAGTSAQRSSSPSRNIRSEQSCCCCRGCCCGCWFNEEEC